MSAIKEINELFVTSAVLKKEVEAVNIPVAAVLKLIYEKKYAKEMKGKV